MKRPPMLVLLQPTTNSQGVSKRGVLELVSKVLGGFNPFLKRCLGGFVEKCIDICMYLHTPTLKVMPIAYVKLKRHRGPTCAKEFVTFDKLVN